MGFVRLAALATPVLVLLAAPLGAESQPGSKVYRIAVASVLSVGDMTAETTAAPGWRAFFVELRRLGYVEGQNLVVERRSTLGRPERFPEIAAEVVRLKPDVIVVGPNRLAAALKVQTATIPIVGASLTAPLESGLITSLARPGGNLTGLTEDAGPEIFSKQLELLTEAVPGTSRVAFVSITTVWNGAVGRLLRGAARQLGVTLVALPMDGPVQEEQYLEAFGTMTRTGTQALLVGSTAEHYVNRRLIAKLAVQHRLPTVAPSREFVEVGCLMAYGISTLDNWRHAAHYVDKILKGAKPGDLPIEQPTKFELVINLKTAKALELMIPPAVLARADEIIQ
jgi:putative ABC transport system substrate-binding protein